MDRFDRVSGATEPARARIGARARAGEYDDAIGALFFEHGFKQVGLGRLGCGDNELFDGVGGFSPMGDLDVGGVVQKRAYAFLDLIVDGGREQKRLAVFGRGGDDFFHLGPKAHIEHAVGFVKHEHFDIREAHRFALHEVDEAARCGNKDVDPVFELLDLRVERKAAHDGEDAMVRGGCDGAAHLADLVGELARGAYDEHERPLAALDAAELVHGGQRERGGFARSRFSCSDDVAPFEDKRNGLLLDGGGRIVSKPLDGGKGFLGQSEFVECFCHDLRVSMGAMAAIPCGRWSYSDDAYR